MLASIRVSYRSLFAVLTASLVLTACGGGGSSSGGSTLPSTGSGSGSGTTTITAPASISVSFLEYQPVKTGSAQRSPSFVSPATESISVVLVSANGVTVPAGSASTVTFNVGPTAANCTTSGVKVTCTVSVNAPVGSDVFAVSSYAGTNGTGTQLGTSLTPATVAQNSANVIPLSIGGTIAALQLYLQKNSFTTGTAGTGLVVVVPLDASGAQIVNPGNYNPAIVVTSSDTTGAFSLTLDGAPSGGSATIASPSDQVVLSYSGTGSTTTTVTATAGTSITASETARSAAAGPPPLTSTNTGNFAASTAAQFLFTGSNQQGTVVVSGGVGPYTVTSASASVATVSGTSPTFTITSTGIGSTNLTVSDAASSHFTIPVTVQPAPIAIAVNSCGTSATCTTSTITFPQSPIGGPTPQETGTIGLTGGTGTYNYYFATSGTTTSSYANAALAGSALTITPTGAGNDTLIITSGGQYAAYGIVTGSPFAASLPTALVYCVGKTFSANLPTTATGFTILTGGAFISSASLMPGNPAIFSAYSAAAGTGTVAFTDAAGDRGIVPFTDYSLSFSTYQGAGSANNPNATADEAFTGTNQTDTVTIGGFAGTLSATSTNTSVITVSGVVGNTFTVTSVQPGTAGVTLTDSATGAVLTYPVSVTTATIPISSLHRTP